MRMAMIEVRDLVPAKRNARTDLEDLEEMSDSIRSVGVLQPFIVKPIRGRDRQRYEIIDGNRRNASLPGTGVTHVLCLVRERNNERTDVIIMLVTAMHKELKPLDQARAFQRLIDTGMTAAQVSKQTGFSASTISARMALLRLPAEAQTMVSDGRMTATEALRLSRGLTRRQGSGSAAAPSAVPMRAPARPTWLGPQHRLAAAAAAHCDHRDTRTVIGRTACGQCWEKAIVNDVLAASSAAA
jgi:ParB family chromosome partitioning protein